MQPVLNRIRIKQHSGRMATATKLLIAAQTSNYSPYFTVKESKMKLSKKIQSKGEGKGGIFIVVSPVLWTYGINVELQAHS